MVGPRAALFIPTPSIGFWCMEPARPAARREAGLRRGRPGPGLPDGGLRVRFVLVEVRMERPTVSVPVPLCVPVPFFLPFPLAAPCPAVLLAPPVLRQVHHAVRPLLLPRPLSLSLSLSVPLPTVVSVPAAIPGRPLRGCGAGRGRRRRRGQRVEGRLAQRGW